MFDIYIKDTPMKIDDELVQPASIIIDDFKEEFYIPLTYWSVSDYMSSWVDSLKQGFANKNHAALAVSMYEPGCTNFIFIWVIYFHDDKVFIHNKVLFLDECPDFTIEKINDFVEPRITYNEDGMKISEWSTDLKSVIAFYDSLKK